MNYCEICRRRFYGNANEHLAVVHRIGRVISRKKGNK